MTLLETLQKESEQTLGEKAEVKNPIMEFDTFDENAIPDVVNSIFEKALSEHASDIHFKPKDEKISSELEFSFTAGGGIKYYFAENLAARLQWRFLIPIYFSDVSIFCSDGYCGLFITGGTYLLQYDLTAGIAFSF